MLRKFCLFCIIPLCPFSAIAQVTGSITGTVRDTSDAVIPGAKVAISNGEHGIHRETITNTSGDYLVQALGEGIYTVTISAPGFRRFIAQNTILRVGQNARVDARLQIGSQTADVTVQGSSAGTIETQSSELSTTITADQISQLELNGRSFVQLIELSPGVSNQTGQSEGVTGPGGSVSYSINGGRTEYNNWEIDGGDVLDSGSMSNLNVFPNVDALDEVQILTSSYDAQYGRSGSGSIEAVTKSGTNHLHGDAFEYLRNQMFNARNYFDLPNDAIGAYKKHDFGGTIGGPIVIPHIYNGHDKSFFFFSEEIRRENVPGFYSTPIPTNAERAGDFSAVCPSPGTTFYRTVPDPPPPGYPSSDPTYPDCPAYNSDAAQDGGYIGFPNNNLAPYIDQTNAADFLKLIPTQNTTIDNTPYFQEAAGAPYTWHEELFKIDQNINSKLHASFRFIHDAPVVTLLTSTPWAQSNLPGIPGLELEPGVSLVFNLNWTPSSTLTNELMIGYGANHISITNTSNAGALPSNLTMTGLFNNNFGGKIPSFNITGGETFGTLNQDAGPVPFYNSNPTYTYRDTVTKLLHSHNLKTGFYFTSNQKNEDAELNTQGYLGFSGNGGTYYTAPQANGGINSTGNSFADFLVGDITTYTQSNQEPKYHFKFKIFEPFVQDDWHVNKRLTLNLGFRMSMFGLYTEKNQLAYNFDPTKFNAANMPTVDPNTGQLDFGPGQSINNLSGIMRCGAGGIPNGCMTGHIWNPAPRIGFAYDLFGDGKTALRAAYGIFYEHTNGNEANAESLEGQPPLVLTPLQFFIQGYQNIGGGVYFPLSPNSIPTRVKWPYMQQYHLDIQRQLMKDTIATVSYVGSKGTHLTLQNDLNQLHDLNQATNPFPKGTPINNAQCNDLNNGNPAYVGNTEVVGDALLHLNVACGAVDPDNYRENFPGWSTIDGIGLGAISNYNALQVSARRTATNLELTLAYTYSHAIDNESDRYDGNFVDSYNLRANRASSNLDQRHILNVSYIYTLPKLRGHSHLTQLTLGGWQWSGITEFQTGKPFSVVNGWYGDNAGVANGEGTGSYVDFVPNVSRSHITGPKYQSGPQGPLLFNPQAYVAPTGLTFGDSGRNSLFGPHTTNFDMGIFKRFPMGERLTAEFRTEAFNVFNHSQFTGVNNYASCFEQPNANSPTLSTGTQDCVDGNGSTYIASDFLHPDGVHDPRILQFALKLLF